MATVANGRVSPERTRLEIESHEVHCVVSSSRILYPQGLVQVQPMKGSQRLSGRVIASRLRGCGFEPHQCHCVVALSKTH